MMRVFIFFMILSSSVIVLTNGSFVEAPNSTINIRTGESIQLKWVVQGNPVVFHGNWKLNNKRIVSYTNGSINIDSDYTSRLTLNGLTLTISNIKNEDHGTIRCEIILDDGHIFINKTNLYVIVNSISSASSLIETRAGDATTLSCDAQSRPDVTITWKFGEVILTNSSGRVIEETSSTDNTDLVTTTTKLVIASIKKEDYGRYTCFANNIYGNSEKEIIVRVQYPLEIRDVQDSYGTVIGATNFELKCNVFGNLLATVIWKRDSIELQNSSDYTVTKHVRVQPSNNEEYIVYTLRFTTVKNLDFANYTCQAIYFTETIEKNVQVVVSDEPYFLETPGDIFYAELGKQKVMNCTVQAAVKLSVLWTIPSLPNQRVSGVDNVLLEESGRAVVQSSFTLDSVTNDHGGIVNCYVDDGTYQVNANSLLIVQYKPTITDALASQVTIQENKVFEFHINTQSLPPASASCNVTDSNGSTQSVAITTKNISITQKAVNQQHSISFMDGITRNLAGIYTCIIINEIGSITVSTDIVVEWGPEFLSASSILKGDIVEDEGGSVTFSCFVASNPLSKLTWYKDDIAITGGNITGGEDSVGGVVQSVLVLNNLQYTDNGTYVCSVEVVIGGSTVTQYRQQVLNVKYAPVLLEQSGTIRAIPGESLTLSCRSRAYPPISKYNWTAKGESSDVNGRDYIIVNVQLIHEGVYTCVAINAEGESTMLVYNVTVIRSPTFTTSPNCTSDEQMLYCVCDGAGVPKPSIEWIDSSDAVHSTSMYMNRSLNKDVTGTYTCKLTNTHGVLSSQYQVTANVLTRTWTAWSDCSVTCGNGEQTRTRECKINDCGSDAPLSESIDCNAGACPTIGEVSSGWHKDEYIIVWVLIPIIFVLLIILFLWLSRRRRNSEKAIIVPMNRGISNPPSIRTQRDIYLPDENELPVVNNGYVPDGPMHDETPNLSRSDSPSLKLTKGKETDSLEIKVEFGEESRQGTLLRSDNPYTRVGETSSKTKTNSLNDPDHFLKHYDKAGGPPIDEQHLFEKDFHDGAFDDDEEDAENYLADMGEDNNAFYAQGYAD